MIARPDLASDANLNSVPKRVARRAEVDRAVALWVARESADACAAQLAVQGIAAGAIVNALDLPAHENIVHRRMLQEAPDSLSGKANDSCAQQPC